MGMRFNDSTAYARSMGPAQEDGRSAWEDVRDAVLARTGTTSRRPNVDVQEAAERVMSAMGALHADPTLCGRMKVLAEHGMFRFERLGRAQTLAWALWCSRSQAKASNALPAWKVPQALVDEGAAVRARMLRVMTCHLEFDAEDGPKGMSVTLVNDRRQLANHLRLLGDVATTRWPPPRGTAEFVARLAFATWALWRSRRGPRGAAPAAAATFKGVGG